ncbi:glycosyl hydrolase family 28-related protein [Blastococcus montanus]|uniref:glycosyl hydrolase family 28-related protein n=1 Tax=Blastococcus montanus TaxID=3144973 RepID=UPI0032078C93
MTTSPARLPRSRPPFRRLGGALAVAVALLVAPATAGVATAAPPPTTSAISPDLGPNVTVFDPSMPVSEIQAVLDTTWERQRDNEMGSERYAYLFLPGVYGTATEPLQIKVGYYTEITGLGEQPTDVVINGKVEVYNRCLDDGGTSNCIALNNFWRTVSNLTIAVNGTGQDGCRATANFWAVSQAVSMRRVGITGANLSLMDYCTAGPQYASGGFIADSDLPFVINGSQQQWLTRNSVVAGWSNGVWNQVFSGVVGAPDDATFPDPPYTTLETTPVSREKPYLFVDDDGRYGVRVPSARTGSAGTTWADGATPGRTIPLTEFFVATPASSVQEINNQLARGKHLLLTPGVYDIEKSIAVKRAGTVVLGLGQATLTAVGGATPLTIADVPGAVVAGVTVDAGTEESPVLLQVGKPHGNGGKSDPANPTTLSDVYFRVGGPHIGKADIALQVNSDDVLIDHTWVWRADHGVEDFTEGYLGDTDRWQINTGRNGAVINGDRVTATGLFVEHFQEHNTIWNGEDGTVVLYQNELPYDPPSQADWQEPDGTLGWAGYKVGDDVQRHRLYGGGVYGYQRNAAPGITTEHGFEVPETPGVQLHHVMTVHLDGVGVIEHVVNDVGGRSDSSTQGQPQYVVRYPAP